MTVLRLARAQGVLAGPRLNPAQVTALLLLDQTERYERFGEDLRKEVLDVKLALLTNSPTRGKRLFPEYFGVEEDEQDGIEQRVEQDEITPDISAEIERFVAERGGTMTGAEVFGDDGWM